MSVDTKATVKALILGIQQDYGHYTELTALLLRHSLELETEAVAVEKAMDDTIGAGARTADLGGKLTTTQMADEIIQRL